MLGNIMWAKNNYTGAAWRYQLALEADPQDQEALNTLRALKCYLKYHHSAQSQAPLETQTKVNNSYISRWVDNSYICIKVNNSYIRLKVNNSYINLGVNNFYISLNLAYISHRVNNSCISLKVNNSYISFKVNNSCISVNLAKYFSIKVQVIL